MKEPPCSPLSQRSDFKEKNKAKPYKSVVSANTPKGDVKKFRRIFLTSLFDLWFVLSRCGTTGQQREQICDVLRRNLKRTCALLPSSAKIPFSLRSQRRSVRRRAGKLSKALLNRKGRSPRPCARRFPFAALCPFAPTTIPDSVSDPHRAPPRAGAEWADTVPAGAVPI